jgi:hypothetical protein
MLIQEYDSRGSGIEGWPEHQEDRHFQPGMAEGPEPYRRTARREALWAQDSPYSSSVWCMEQEDHQSANHFAQHNGILRVGGPTATVLLPHPTENEDRSEH